MVRQTKNSKSETHLPRSPYTEIKEATLNYSASDRILQLSNPKIKKDNHLRLGIYIYIYYILINYFKSKSKP